MLLSYHQQGVLEAGCDEAGRGCLAGPVVAAAVILPGDYHEPTLNDSKKLSKAIRENLRLKIQEHAIDYGIGVVHSQEIDKINILNASFKAMHLALGNLKFVNPELILVDGNRFIPYKTIKHTCIVKGDGKYMSIAAASVLAKTYRDEIMRDYAKKYPYYRWDKNAGYPTSEHRKAILTYGITEYHRKSFRLIDDQLRLFKDLL